MTTMQRDPLVADYLRRLETAAAHLPRDRRAELVAEIEEHVDAALGEAGARDETTVRNVLERLGPPEEIAAAAGPVPAARPQRGPLETAALIVLALSFLLPLVGYLIGVGLVLASTAWDGREKLIALLIGPVAGLAAAFAVLFLSAAFAADDPNSFNATLGPLEIAVVAWAASGALAALYLASRLRRPTAE